MQRNGMMKNVSPQPYVLSDFYLAAYLLCKGRKLLRTEPGGQNRVRFVLDDSPNRQQLIEDFYAHRATVDPLAFKDAIVNLKSFLHGLRPAN